MFKTIKVKSIVYCSAIIFVMTLILSIYFFYTSKAQIEKNVVSDAQRSVEYFQENIDQMMRRCEDVSDYIYLNRMCGKVLIRNYDNQKYNIDRDIHEAIKELRVRIENDVISSYINGIIIGKNDSIMLRYGNEADYWSDKQLQEQRWFQENSNNHIFYWGNAVLNQKKEIDGYYTIPVVRTLISPDTFHAIGWQFMSVSTRIISDILDKYNFDEETIIIACDRNGNCVYSNEMAYENTTIHAIKEIEHYNDGKWLLASDTSNYSGITIYYLISRQNMQSEMKRLYQSIFLVAIISLIAGFTMMFWFSNSLTRPLQRILAKMDRISKGDFSRDISLEGRDEMGMIGSGINNLAENVDDLMKKRQNDIILKKEMEYKTLENQINPHFIYNVLNSIKVMADLQGAEGISQMILNFSCLLKETIKGVDKQITVEKEFELMDKYIYLQKMRKKGLIRVSYEIEEECREFKILKFLLQPLVENAIIHGLDQKNGMGILKLQAQREGDFLLISIYDNGGGMLKEEIENVFKEKEKRKNSYNEIGIKNVQERIKILYGDEFGISIESEVGVYTTVRVKLPIIL